MKQFAMFNYVFAAICLVAAIVMFFINIPNIEILAFYTLLAVAAFAISGFLAQKIAKEDEKK